LNGFVIILQKRLKALTALQLINTSYAIPETPLTTFPFLPKVLQRSPKLEMEMFEFSGNRLQHMEVVKRLQSMYSSSTA
jgi:hypothetical protein